MTSINTEYIELDKLLKREDLAASGGEARYLISQGLARVNGVVETRKRRKLYPGDLVSFNGVEMRVTDKEPCPARNSETEQDD
jgi:ribosome-associated protein